MLVEEVLLLLLLLTALMRMLVSLASCLLCRWCY